MHSQQSTFAVIVSAETFELLNSAGVVVGRLAAVAASFAFAGGSGLEMLHLDATVQDSALAWTQNNPDGTGQQVTLRGPSDIGVTDPPNVLLDVSPTTSRARLRAGRKAASPAIAVVDATTSNTGNAQITALASAGSFSSTLVSVEAVASGNGGTASMKVDGWTGEAFLNASGVGGSDVSLRVGTIRRVRAVGGDIGIYPSAAGRLYLNSSAVRCQNGEAGLALAGSVSVGFRSFIGPSIAANLEPGDLVSITMNARILANAAGGAAVAELQVFGPGGNFVAGERLVAEGYPAFMSNSCSGTWLYTAGLGAGTYTFAMVGGTVAGSYTFVAPDTWMTLNRFTQRGYI